MHQQAIEIKERLLGPDDYEVALSVGHLASLYNYDMHKYTESEKLYQRSIKIGQTHFHRIFFSFFDVTFHFNYISSLRIKTR